jgi:hypothetical protein
MTVPAHLLPERCYVCGGEPGDTHPDPTPSGGHAFWSNADAAAHFAAEDARLSRPGHAEARYVATYRPY